MDNKFSRDDVFWCGSGSKYRKCKALIEERITSLHLKGYEVPKLSLLKTKQ